MIKVADEIVKAIGATNAAEFSTKLAEKLAQDSKAFEATAALGDAVKALEDRIAALEAAKPEATTQEWLSKAIRNIAFTNTEDSAFAASIRTIAASEGSKVAAEALAKTGTNPVAPSVTENPATPAQVAAANGDWKAQYAADPEIRKQFPDADVYDAYKRLESEGRVKITTKRN